VRRVRVGTSNKAVLVTGATGFMVRHVGRHLIEAGRLVVALARWRGGIFAQARVVKIGDKEINRLIEFAGVLRSVALSKHRPGGEWLQFELVNVNEAFKRSRARTKRLPRLTL